MPLLVISLLALLMLPMNAPPNTGSSNNNAWFSRVEARASGDQITVNAEQSNGGTASGGSAGGSRNNGGSGAAALPACYPNCLASDLTGDPLIDYSSSGSGPSLWNIPTAPGAPPAPAAPAAGGPTFAQAEGLARKAATSLRLPALAPRIGPDPAGNEWNMMAVGYPIWLWTDTTTLGGPTSVNGIAMSLTASNARTTYRMGDGSVKTCSRSTPMPANTPPMTSSPTCGYTYLKAGSYTITATTTWFIQWQALGYSGTLGTTTTASTPLEVGELLSVITHN